MKDWDNILQDKHLKDKAFTLPDNYFEELSNKMMARVSQADDDSKRWILAPYFAYAATLCLMLLVGSVVIKVSTPEKEDMDNIYYSYCLDSRTEPDAIYYSYVMDEDKVSNDDIVEYLIFNQTSSLFIDELNH